MAAVEGRALMVSELADLLQWPAFLASVAAAWLVASERKGRRNWGFCIFLASNVLWSLWGVQQQAWALVALQVCLAIMNVRGLKKTDD